MTHLWSAKTSGFYHSAHHGRKSTEVPYLVKEAQGQPDTDEYRPPVINIMEVETQSSFIPDDAVEIDEGYYLSLREGLAQGMKITSDEEGRPVLVESKPALADNQTKRITK